MSSTLNGTQYQHVKLVGDDPDNTVQRGQYRPTLVTSIPSEKINVLVNSQDRVNGNPYNFYTDLRTETTAPLLRTISLSSVIFPQAFPQIITGVNDTLLIRSFVDGSSFTITIPQGFYTVNSFANQLQSLLSAGWTSMPSFTSVVVTYDPVTRRITITNTSSPAYNWFFDGGTFLTYGKSVAQFPYGISNKAVSVSSFTLDMIYTQYVYVMSGRLCQSQRSYSLTSNGNVSGNNLVGIIPLQATVAQMNSTGPYPGQNAYVPLQDQPKINMMNSTLSLRQFDLYLVDQYGFRLSDILPPAYQYDGTYIFSCEF